ncbi:MAG TPA: thioesterase family protein [Polyangiaceae bacterium]|nr:thioesterase family protein [Polyangiaceae bacterium]
MVELGEARAAELTVEAVVEPRFLDAMGHMNVAWYVYLFDRGIWEFFERHGLDEGYRQRSARGMFALEENLRYQSELREGQPLHVYTAALEVRPKTLRLQQYMVDCDANKVAAVREVVAAHIDLSSRRSAPFSDAVLAQLHAAPHVVPSGGLSEASAQRFARDWVAAWNRRDAEAVLSHYADDAVFISPKAERFVGKPRIDGKAALRAYWQTALSQIQSLEFVLDHALWSPRAETLTVVYQASLAGQPPVRVAEIMHFQGNLIVRGEALYGAAIPA